jgi:glycosyltransferase involved in cell wall biosynthesis
MSAVASLAAAPRLGIPVVHTFHALGTVKRRHQGHNDTSPAERIATEASIVRQVDRIVATCRDEVCELVGMGADADCVSNVPCGVDTDLFLPAGPAWSCTPGRHRLVAIGRLVERKGIDDIIGAVAQVPDCELIIAGGPDIEQLTSDNDAVRLIERARRADVADRVHLVGRLDRNAVPCLLRSADLAVCVPWYEPFGIVPVEAMSCGVPVVASHVGGLSDTVVDGVTGVHVPPRQPRHLARILRELLADQARRAAMGQAGRARAMERYQWKRVAEDTVSAYEAAGAMQESCRMTVAMP